MNDIATTQSEAANLAELTAEIVSAYVAKNSVPASELPSLLHSIHTALGQLGAPTVMRPEPEELKPAVPIRKSITDDYLISLESGKRFKSLKRHLMTSYGMTPQQYRDKWNLPKDYPMVAPAYASSRSALARSLGLGRKPNPKPIEAPPPAPVTVAAPAKRAGRPKKAAADVEAAE